MSIATRTGDGGTTGKTDGNGLTTDFGTGDGAGFCSIFGFCSGGGDGVRISGSGGAGGNSTNCRRIG